MPVYQAEALILRTYKLGEADRIVVFLTRDRGKKRGVAKGARRPKSRYMGALEPMTRAGVAYYEREQRELVRLNFVEPTRSPLSGSGDALGHVGYFAELIDEWAPESHTDEKLYRLGSSVVDALAAGAPIEPLARYFEYLAPPAAGRVSVDSVVRRMWGGARRGRLDATARNRAGVPGLRDVARGDGALFRGDGVPGVRHDDRSRAIGNLAARPARRERARSGAPAANHSPPRERVEVRARIARNA